ncbi:tetratricopeptide repeat protein [Candidatus Peregrinibacteria bacterium]|nr:tetratricopeptide repeat protein [Candidatus Peregrinibacteria bacterium]
MNKFLLTLWIIIISGGIFISYKLTKPESANKENLAEIKTQQQPEKQDVQKAKENNADTSTKSDTPTKSYASYILQGDEDLKNNNLASAIGNYSSATDLKPDSTDAFLKLGKVYLSLNDPQKAKSAFQKVEKLSPQLIEANLGIAESYLNLRDIESAKTIIWKMDKSNPNVKYYTGIILILHKDFAGAKKLFTEISEDASQTQTSGIKENSQVFLEAYKLFSYFKEGEQIFLETLLAKSLTEIGQFESSIPLLYDVINQKNNYRDAWTILGYAYLNTNKIQDAIDAFSQAESLYPEKPQTLFFLGLAHYANNDIDKAIHYLEKAKEYGFEPKEEIELKLGDIYLLKKDYSKSAEQYEKVVSLNLANVDIFVRTAWIYIEKLKDPEKALAVAYKSLEKYPSDSMSYNLMGWSLIAKGEFEKSKDYLNKAIQMKPNFDAAYLNFGWLMEKQGQVDMAKEYYKNAYTLGAGNAISLLATKRLEDITNKELKTYKFQTDISSLKTP